MKESYIAPTAEFTVFSARETIAVLSSNFSDFFTKTINDELALTGDNNLSDS